MHQFLLSRRGYASFRIYAKHLGDVEPLKKFFEEKGIMVSTQAERIHEVRELDKYLTLIFWLIAIVGVVGGAATLSASLYSSVERKRKELSILRLIGLSGAMIFRFPIYQGIVIATNGVMVALLFFAMMATVINKLFQAHLQSGESFCTLTGIHISIVLLFTVFLAVIASGIAAYRATQTDPAEAMRDE
jgi:putative ABC transport system permease protein